VLECDEFFLKFLEPFKRFKASDEAAAWEADGKLEYKVRTELPASLCCVVWCVCRPPEAPAGVSSCMHACMHVHACTCAHVE
jgi:hypothetical protein